MFTRVLQMSFWVGHDHLGTLLVANMCCALFSAAPIVAGAALLAQHTAALPARAAGAVLVAAGALLTPVLFTGLLHFVKVCIETGDGSLADFFAGVRRFAATAAGLGVAYLLLAANLAACAWWYPAWLKDTAPLVGYVMAGFALLALALLACSALYAGPALVNRPTGPAGALQLAVMIVLDKPGFTFALALAAGSLAVLAVAPPWLFLGAYAGMAVLLASAYEMLAHQYAATADGAPLADTPAGDYLNRGWADLLHPWKL